MKLVNHVTGVLASLLVISMLFVYPVDARVRHVRPISPEYDVTGLAAQAKSEVVVIGTLSTFGSFEWGVSPLVTLAAASIKHVPQMLHDRKITVDEAQKMINAAVKTRNLLKSANATCSQDNAGKCTGDEGKARALADQAKAVIAGSCLSLNEKEVLTCLHH